MGRLRKDERLQKVHGEATRRFERTQTQTWPDRLQCLEDRKFCSVAGEQWAGYLGEQMKNRPRFEFNKIQRSITRIFNEYRNNRISVSFVPRSNEDTVVEVASFLNGLFMADEADSVADEAYDNAFDEAVTGGMGALRARVYYEDDTDEDNEQLRIKIEPIYDADCSVYFDLSSRRQDKSDAQYCFVVYPMTKEAFTKKWKRDASSWPSPVENNFNAWGSADTVYVAEYYDKEEKSIDAMVFRHMDGTEERFTSVDFTNDPELREMLEATGSEEIRSRKVKRSRIHKYILSGGEVLEDSGYISGEHIPIVPVYGKRVVVDGLERISGHPRPAKDTQRLKNMLLSRLAEMAAMSVVEKPIFLSEQINDHKVMWSRDNIDQYAYMTIDKITNSDGTEQAVGPLGYTKSPSIPPALAAIADAADVEMKDILGDDANAEKLVSNVSGKTVDLIQQRLDMYSFIYIDNFRKAMKRLGEVWLSQARDIYNEQGRTMKLLDDEGTVSSDILHKPVLTEEGKVEIKNDLSKGRYDVNVTLGPHSASKRQMMFQNIVSLLQLPINEEFKEILLSVGLSQMEEEGFSELRPYFRRKLVLAGVIPPNEEEKEELAQLQGRQGQDSNVVYLQSLAEEASAKAASARVDTVRKTADAELKQAKTLETMEKVAQMREQ